MPLRRDASSFDDAREPAAREEAYFARGLLAEDRRSYARGATESRRDATRVSLAKEPERRQQETRESLGRRCGGDRAEFLRDRGRATRHRHVCIFM